MIQSGKYTKKWALKLNFCKICLCKSFTVETVSFEIFSHVYQKLNFINKSLISLMHFLLTFTVIKFVP